MINKELKTNIKLANSDSNWASEIKKMKELIKKSDPHKVPIQVHSKKGLSEESITAYRPGACSNCGAISHKAKDCIERPRKMPAKYSGSNFGRDEIYLEVPLGYQAKRDQFANFDPVRLKQREIEFREIEEQKKLLGNIDEDSEDFELEKFEVDVREDPANEHGHYSAYLTEEERKKRGADNTKKDDEQQDFLQLQNFVKRSMKVNPDQIVAF